MMYDKANTAPGGPDTQAAAGGLIKSSTAALALVVWSTVCMLLSVGKLVFYFLCVLLLCFVLFGEYV